MEASPLPPGDPVETETPLMVTEVGAPISSGALGGATWGGAGAVSLGAPPPRGATVASRVTLAPSPLLTDIDWGSELGAAPLLLFSLEDGQVWSLVYGKKSLYFIHTRRSFLIA